MGKYNIERISQQIRIGWDGENNWRPQTFDCSSLLATRPNGAVTLWILPNGESEAFPVALTADGNLRTWTPLDSELVGGGGKLQFHCQSGTDIGKSPVYRYVVENSILTGAEHPDETPSWAVQVVADVQDAIDGISETVEELLPDAVEDYMVEHPFVETDPTVPAWAKAATKPTYTAQEVGAMPSSYVSPVTSVNGQTGVVVLDAEDVGALPDDTVIPAAVTEQTVSGWGFTKNTGTYSKPSGGIPDSDIASAATWNAKGTYSKPASGIPASDLAAGVIPTVPTADISANTAARHTHDNKALLDTYTQTESNLADAVTKKHTHSNKTVLDEIDATKVAAWDAKGTYSKPSGGIPKTDLASDVQTSLGKADTALQSHQSLAAYRTASAQDTIDAGKLGISENAYRSASIPMGELDSTSTATVMTATVPGITELRDGVCMWLRNGVVTSASGFTLNINGLGAKPCYSSLAAESRSTTIFNVNYAMLMIYNSTRVDGGCWDIVYGVDTNTTYTPPKLGFGYGTCTTAAATAAKTASISSYALTTCGIVSIKFSYDVPANATLNITSKGAKAIYHRGAAITAGVITAGDTATFIYSTYYHLISIDRDETADLTNYQTKAITDTGGYFTTDTVDGALQEIGAELAGINTLIGSGVIS